MTKNFPGPYQLRLKYTVTPDNFAAIQHTLNLNVNLYGSFPGDGTLTDVVILRKDAGQWLLADFIEELVEQLQPHYNADDTTFDFAELWKITDQAFSGIYIGTEQVGLPGTATGTTKIATASIYQFRTQEGGLMKIQLMEDIFPGGFRIGYAGLGTESAAFVDWVMSALYGPAILGRDTSYPIAFLNVAAGQHEATFKARYR